MRSRRRVARISVFVGLAIVFGGIAAAVAQQGPVIKIYELRPDRACAFWLEMRPPATSSGPVNTIRSAYVQGFTSALWGTGVRPIRHSAFESTTAYQPIVDALDVACAQQPGKPIAHVLLNLLGYR